MTTQATLDGDTTDTERQRPETWLWCDECEKPVLRSQRFDHEHDLSDSLAIRKQELKRLKDKIPEHAKVDTATYQITFHYEMVETVQVEASCKSDAKTRAEDLRTFNGEIMQTVHTEKRRVTNKSQATIDYLERYNLLPEDHDITRDEIQELLKAESDGEI